MFNRRLLVSTSGGGSVPKYQMISGGASTYIGYDSNDGVGFLEPNTITVLPDEPNELITRFVAQDLTYGMLQFGFTSMELGSPFKSINLVFTFPELSLPPVTFHWYDMSPDGQLYYATSADTGAMELWDRIAGYPGEPLGFNIEVVKS